MYLPPGRGRGVASLGRDLGGTKRREKSASCTTGAFPITPIRVRIGRRSNGALGDAWRRDADVVMCLPSTCPPADGSPRDGGGREPSVSRRDVARESRPDNREDGAARTVRLQEL